MHCKTTGKLCHPTKGEAFRILRRVNKQKNIVLHVFHCSHCKQWHLGNTRSTHLENMNRLFDRIKRKKD